MDEIEALKVLGGDIPAPDPEVKLAARMALLAHAQVPAGRARWWPSGGLALGRLRVLGAAAALVLVAVVAGGVLPIGPRSDPAAAAALIRAADVAALQPDVNRDGYRHTMSEGAHLASVATDDERPGGVWALVPVSREVWIKPDGSGRLVERRGEPVWFGPADKAAWVAQGSPDLRGNPSTDTRFGPTTKGSGSDTPQIAPGSLYYANVDALPTDVDALRGFIRAQAAANGGGATNLEMFTIVGDLLRETVAAPRVRSALYRVAAGIEGVELQGSVTDHAGRSGTAVSLATDRPGVGRERHVLIFDPDTAVLLEDQDVLLDKVRWLDAEPPTVIGYTTYLTSQIVPTDV
jgi:hypothetical protein